MSIRERFKKILKNIGTIRFLAVTFSILLWYFVNNETNPVVTMEVSVPLKIKNDSILQDAGYTISNSNLPPNVVVKLKGRKSNMERISGDKFEASLALEKDAILSNRKMHRITVLSPAVFDISGVVIDTYYPKELELDIEKINREQFPVEITVKGEVRKGYRVTKVYTIPENIFISGAESFLNSINSIKTVVDVSGLSKDSNLPCVYRLYDKEGREIKMEDKNPKLNVQLEIGKVLPVVPVFIGKPEGGRMDDNVVLKPQEIVLRGNSAVLEKIDRISTENISLTGIRENLKKNVKLMIPSECTVVNQISETQIEVKFHKNETKKLTVLSDKIKLLGSKNGYTYKVDTKSVDFELVGVKAELDKLDSEDILLEADVAGLGEGRGRVRIQFTGPANIKPTSERYLDVTVEKAK